MTGGGDDVKEPSRREIAVILTAVRAAQNIIEETRGFPDSDVSDKDGYLRELFYCLNSACIKLHGMHKEAT